MSDQTKIAWSDSTFSPWVGCTKVSPGCAACYAADYGRRFGVEWGPGKKRRRTSAAYWKKPLAWNKRRLCARCGGSRTSLDEVNLSVWCADCGENVHTRPRRVFPSLCDPFDPEVPVEWLADFFDVIRRTPNLTWLLLTKRPELWRERMVEALDQSVWLRRATSATWLGAWLIPEGRSQPPAPPENVWLGVSAEDQPRWDERVPVLLSIPAVKWFVSVEPMLERIDMRLGRPAAVPAWWQGKLNPLSRIDWIIFGGESGRNARPCNVDWIRDGVRQCREAGVACFTKQLGAHVIDDDCVSATPLPREQCWPSGVEYHESDRRIILHDRSGSDPSEWPPDLRVREVPA